MRYKNLLLSSIIGLIGMICYFATIPTINEDKMVQLTVEAGDESQLDDVFLGGYLYGYSSYLIAEKETSIYDGIPYLKKLDSIDDFKGGLLQQKHPDFLDNLYFDTKKYAHGILTSDNHLISAHFEQGENYYANLDQIYLNILDKATDEIKEEVIQRINHPVGNVVEFLGMTQNYPSVKLLIHTYTWDSPEDGYTSQLSVIEYNTETKNYSEAVIHQFIGSYYPNHYTWVFNNESLVLLTLDENNYLDEFSTTTPNPIYAFNFEDNSFKPIDNDGSTNFLVSDNNELYSYNVLSGEIVLRHLDKSTFETLSETTLVISEEADAQENNAIYIPTILNEKVYLAESQLSETSEANSAGIKPSKLYVYQIGTGEQLLQAEIEYDLDETGLFNEAIMENIGLLTNY